MYQNKFNGKIKYVEVAVKYDTVDSHIPKKKENIKIYLMNVSKNCGLEFNSIFQKLEIFKDKLIDKLKSDIIFNINEIPFMQENYVYFFTLDESLKYIIKYEIKEYNSSKNSFGKIILINNTQIKI